MKLHHNPFLCLSTLAAIGIVLTHSSASAADATWASASNGTWITAVNWTPAAAPGATTGTANTDVATFNNLGYQSITLPTNENNGGITFATTGSSPNPFFLTGGSLLPSASAVIQTDSTYRGIADINTAITTQGALTLTFSGAAGSGLLTNTITTAASLGNVTLTLNGSNSGFNGVFGSIIAGGISENATGSTLKVSKSGAGTWDLANANSYTGGTDLNGGTVVTGNAASLGSSGTIAVLGTTTLRTLVGLTDPSSRITISDAATLTFDTYGVNQTWAGVLGNSGTSNTAALTKTGLGVLTITPAAGAVQTLKGATTANMGTLTISGASQTGNFSNIINSSSALVLGGGNINFTGKVGFTNSQTFNGTTLNAGVSGFIPAASTGTNTFDFGTITRNTGSLLDVVTASGYTIKAGAMGNDAGGLVRGVLFNGDFTTSTAGTLGATTYTTQNAAGSWTGGAANYVTGAAVTGSVGTATINSLKLNNASSQDVSITGALSVNDGILFGSSIGGNTSTISGGIVTGPSGGGSLIVVNNNAQNVFGRNTISSVIKDYTASDFAGAGTNGVTNLILYGRPNNSSLYISGNNTYTGNTYIGGGANGQVGNNTMKTIIGGAAGASIGSASATVYVNGGSGGANNILQVGDGDATGDVLGITQLDNGRLSLARTDTFSLTATVAGTAGGGSISQDRTGTASLTLASGTNLFQSLGSTAAGTLNVAGTGTYFFNSTANGFNAGSTTNFNSGTYYFNGTTNTGNTLGNWAINGATVTLGGGRYFGNSGGSLTLTSGTFRDVGNAMNQQGGSGAAFTYNISGGSLITVANSNSGASASWAPGGGTNTSTGDVIVNHTAGFVTVGSPENANISSNQFNNLLIGTGTSSHASTYNLSGGTLRSFGGVAAGGAAGGGGSNNFNWTGGTLTTLSYNSTDLTSNDGVSAAATGTLFQGGITSVLAPGETFNGQVFAGKTTITGNYKIDAGTVAIGIGGATAATVFHNTATGTFDNLTATGTAALGGNLNVTLRNGFTPANSDTFTIITGSGGVSGSFANVSGGKVTLIGGATFDVDASSGTSVVLKNYTPGAGGAGYATWAAANGIPGQPFTGDFDMDGISNGMEYALGKSPTTSSQPAGIYLGNTITYTKGAQAITNADVSWTIETSTTLTGGSWTPEVTQASGDATATIAYTFTPSSPAKKFARLKVVQVP